MGERSSYLQSSVRCWQIELLDSVITDKQVQLETDKVKANLRLTGWREHLNKEICQSFDILCRMCNKSKNLVKETCTTLFIPYWANPFTTCWQKPCFAIFDRHIFFSFVLSVSNKWIHERGQEFRRPCGLTEVDWSLTHT